MASGFVTNTAKTSISSTSAFTSTLLAEQTTGTPSDARSKALPGSCSFSQLDIVFTSWADATKTFDVYLTWDSAGDDPLTSKAESISVTEGGTSGTVHTVISLDKLFITAPSGQTTTGKCYLWIKPGEACVVEKARLHWHDKT
tara:strand:- start:6120 stop:6548 length:429 start_codon:yes stop_codon:yes gene_type:complete